MLHLTGCRIGRLDISESEDDMTYTIPEVRVFLKDVRPLYENERIASWSEVGNFLRKEIGNMDREYFVEINVDTSLRPINYTVVGVGGLAQCYVEGSNVFKPAILSNARAVILAHNHPSGSLEFSEYDIKCTKKLVRCGKDLMIPVLDHILVTKNNYVSMKERRVVKF